MKEGYNMFEGGISFDNPYLAFLVPLVTCILFGFIFDIIGKKKEEGVPDYKDFFKFVMYGVAVGVAAVIGYYLHR